MHRPRRRQNVGGDGQCFCFVAAPARSTRLPISVRSVSNAADARGLGKAHPCESSTTSLPFARSQPTGLDGARCRPVPCSPRNSGRRFGGPPLPRPNQGRSFWRSQLPHRPEAAEACVRRRRALASRPFRQRGLAGRASSRLSALLVRRQGEHGVRGMLIMLSHLVITGGGAARSQASRG